MAYSDLTELLRCPLCLGNLSDPVTLNCGHNFCLVCIKSTLTSSQAGSYTCPQCGYGDGKRPQLRRNTQLSNIAQHLRSTKAPEKSSVVYCVSCTSSLVLAVKTCLLCCSSLCLNHLELHSKSADHVLVDVDYFLLDQRCSKHYLKLNRYCLHHRQCVCKECLQECKHSGHEIIDFASALDLKRVWLSDKMETLTTKWRKTLSEIRRLEKEKAELTWKMAHVNAMLNTENAYAVLMERESDDVYFWDLQEEKRKKKFVAKLFAFLLLLLVLIVLVCIVVTVVIRHK